MAAYTVGLHKKLREDDIPFLRQLLTASFEGDIEVYTSTLSIAECQAITDEASSTRILNDDIKKLFKSILTSGQFVVLVQDSVLVAERGRNLAWVHGLRFSGADAIHLASAMEMSCDEFLTFDEPILKKATELEKLGLSIRYPGATVSLKDRAAQAARRENLENRQGVIEFEERNSVTRVQAAEAAHEGKQAEETPPVVADEGQPGGD
jgi:predicted nucleic acid-binding protein